MSQRIRQFAWQFRFECMPVLPGKEKNSQNFIMNRESHARISIHLPIAPPELGILSIEAFLWAFLVLQILFELVTASIEVIRENGIEDLAICNIRLAMCHSN